MARIRTIKPGWTDADRELVASHISDRAPDDAAGDILDALAADGRLADPQELERLRTERANLRQTLDATRQQLLAEANRLMRRPPHPPAAPDTAWWLRRLAECPVCSGPKRETAGMVCQACGKDWGPPAGGKPGFWLDDDGQWQPLSVTPPAALSATESADQPHPGTTERAPHSPTRAPRHPQTGRRTLRRAWAGRCAPGWPSWSRS